MKLLPIIAVKGALLLLPPKEGYFCTAFPSGGTLTIVPSPNNHILYQKITPAPQWPQKPTRGWKITSDVPLTIQRYDDQNNLVFEGNPVDEGDSIILVTSNCDTTATNVVPIVDMKRGEDGATLIDVKLGIPSTEASDMPYLESSSYNSNWIEGTCGPGGLLIEDFDAPEGTTYTPTPCLTESQCDDVRRNNGFDDLQVGRDYPTKGCFTKNGIAYWGGPSRGDENMEAISTPNLPGIQERLWCQKPIFPKKKNNACMTEEECDELRLKYSIDTFQSGNYPTKGCFIKNGAAYWGSGGTNEEMSKSDLPGVQQRIWCGQSVEVTKPAVQSCQSKDGTVVGDNGSCQAGHFCRLEPGICGSSIGSESYGGVCAPSSDYDACVGLYDPVCGCDGETYSIDCEAYRAGVSVLRKGRCDEPPPTPTAPAEDGRCQTESGSFAGDHDGSCRSGEFCKLAPGVCGNGEVTNGGFCTALADFKVCSMEYAPVCGCDGNEYSNICSAHSKGISVSRVGKCEQSPDSGSTNTSEEDIPCLSENDCNQQRLEIGMDHFYSGDYPTKGCFVKNGKAYWSSGGSVADKTEANLPGVQERLWCDKTRSSSSSTLALQQSSSNTKPQSETSSAFSLKSFALTSLLHRAVHSYTERTTSSFNSRNLDTCTYNVEVLISGCQDVPNVDNLSTPIEVAAPKARVIQSETKIVETKTHFAEEIEDQDWDPIYQYYWVEFNHTSKMTFPEDQAESIELVNGGTFVNLPLLDDEVCWLIVCGRPFVDSNGKSLIASSSSSSANYCGVSSSWLGETSMIDKGEASVISKLASSRNNTTKQNDLGKEWTTSALGEHASVASFAAFSMALMTNNAPSHLVEDSLKAALDEVRHAKVSFDIASKLLGRDIGPGPLPPSSHHFDHNLTSLAMSVTKEGCVDETLSALAAAAEVELIDKVLDNGAVVDTKYSGIATDILTWTRNELRTISIDESRHSALAWRTLDWVCSVDAYACNTVRQRVLDQSHLNVAFQRRFGHYFEDTPDILEQMRLAWENIYTGQKAQSLSNATVYVAGRSLCDDDIVKEGSSCNLASTSLFSLLVENILQHG